jgi:protein TonB
MGALEENEASAAADTVKPASTTEREQVSHLSIKPVGFGPAEVPFSFERREGRMGGALGTSLMAHGAMVLVYFLLVWFGPEPVRSALLPDRLSNIVWLVQPGPGGGGGGGNQMPDPPKKAELQGKEEVSVPAEVKPTPEPTPEPPPEQMTIPAQTVAAATSVSPGVIESSSDSLSTGSGPGTGGGSGTGSGLGPGRGGGTGGGVFRPGSGIEIPTLLAQVKPQYTADAMRAKVQGIVGLECVVESNGSVGRCEVTKSLDPTFGLDQEALKAARQWRFRPGTRFGEPVAVLVTIELTFTLR